jgi:hypothetical protein
VLLAAASSLRSNRVEKGRGRMKNLIKVVLGFTLGIVLVPVAIAFTIWWYEIVFNYFGLFK